MYMWQHKVVDVQHLLLLFLHMTRNTVYWIEFILHLMCLYYYNIVMNFELIIVYNVINDFFWSTDKYI